MKYEIKCSHRGEHDYPDVLTEIKGMPDMFYYQGDLGLLRKGINTAVVGSRHCSEQALQFAYEAGEIAAKMDVRVVNGLAVGIDTAALRGALDHGGKCIAILPGGLGNIYPKCNESLADEILDKGGLLMSEYEEDAAPKNFTFVARDRLQSALSQGVFVVEAGEKSGTMHTVRAAIRQRRRLASYSSKITHAIGNRLIEEKAGTMLISNDSDLREFLISLQPMESNHQMTLFEM